MATTALFAEVMDRVYAAYGRDLSGKQFTVPIYAKTDWQKAIDHLEAREAAREEWPFPW